MEVYHELRPWPVTPRAAFYIFDYVFANIGLLAGETLFIAPGTSWPSRLFVYFLALGICTCAFALRWLIFMDKPQPTLQGRALLPKVVLGNTVGLGFMAVFSLQGMPLYGLVLAGLLIFVGGNIGLYLERRWETGYLRRHGRPDP